MDLRLHGHTCVGVHSQAPVQAVMPAHTIGAEATAPWIIVGDGILVLDQLVGIEGRGEDRSLMTDRGGTLIVNRALLEAEQTDTEKTSRAGTGTGIA